MNAFYVNLSLDFDIIRGISIGCIGNQNGNICPLISGVLLQVNSKGVFAILTYGFIYCLGQELIRRLVSRVN
jgi:hypothetical protein